MTVSPDPQPPRRSANTRVGGQLKCQAFRLRDDVRNANLNAGTRTGVDDHGLPRCESVSCRSEGDDSKNRLSFVLVVGDIVKKLDAVGAGGAVLRGVKRIVELTPWAN